MGGDLLPLDLHVTGARDRAPNETARRWFSPHRCLAILSLAVCPWAFADQDALDIQNIQAGSDSTGLYRVWTVRFDLTKTYDNPYDPQEVKASVAFAGPSDEWREMPAFWRGTQTAWEARIAPLELGPHHCLIQVSDDERDSATAEVVFASVPSRDPGFVGIDPTDPYYFRYTTDRPYQVVGQNLCWSIREPAFATWLTGMRVAGENCARVWMVPHVGQGIEWGGSIPGGVVGRYNEAAATEWDTVFAHLCAHGVRAQLCLDSCHGWWFNWDSNWDESPYNESEGGFPSRPIDYLIYPRAKALARQRYRYAVARWGADSSLFAWELFNPDYSRVEFTVPARRRARRRRLYSKGSETPEPRTVLRSGAGRSARGAVPGAQSVAPPVTVVWIQSAVPVTPLPDGGFSDSCPSPGPISLF